MENNYIAQARKGKTGVFVYIGGIILITVGVFLFSIPYSSKIQSLVSQGLADASKVEDFNYLMTLMDSNLTLLYMTFPFLGGMLMLIVAVRFLHRFRWTHLTTARPSVDWKRICFSFLIWGGINAAMILLGAALNTEEVIWNFNAEKFAVLFLIALLMIPIQTSFEEYVFRGYLMQGLGLATKTNWFPLLFTSVAFGLMHLSNPEVAKLGYGIMIFYIGTGFLLGVITLMDEGMELSLGFHAANNLITALLVTTDWTAFQTHAVFRDQSQPNLWLELGLVAGLFPLLIYIFAKKYQWSHWKQKLIG